MFTCWRKDTVRNVYQDTHVLLGHRHFYGSSTLYIKKEDQEYFCKY